MRVARWRASEEVPMRTWIGVAVVAVAVAAVLTAGCGGSDESQFDDPNDTNLTGAPAGSLAGSNPANEFAGCATSSAAADPRPAFLVFVYDRSGSMDKQG